MRDTTRFAQHSQTERLLPSMSVVPDSSLAVRGSHPLWTPHSRRLRRVLLIANGGLTYNSTQAFTRDDSGLGSSLFTRRYLGNRCCFLFHRLVICLSSAGRSWIPEVGNIKKPYVAVGMQPKQTRKSATVTQSHETTRSLRPKP